MPRRSILSAAERESLLALPDTKDELIRHYTFSESDLSIIRQRRGPANRLGFAVQLCYLRFPGVILGADEPPFPPLLRLVANQLKVGIESWDEYGQREQTRREHLVELQTVFGFQPFTIGHYRQDVQLLTELAMQTDKGIVLARALIEHLRRQSVIVPALNAVERASAEAITRANRRLYDALAEPLTDVHRRRLDDLLKRRDNGKTTWLAWLRQSPVKPNSRHMLEHIERLKAWQALDLPSGIERLVDVGSGGGLPGVVLAIARPDLQVDSVETVQKKASFQNQARIELKLSNFRAHHARIENWQPAYAPAAPDGIISRAFADLADFVELTAHLAGPDTRILAMKGLYPAGEGAGYAGGILSAGVDGIKVAEAVALDLLKPA
jgi:16S rRNA (guanine(527)-N(7))-methyltransferase RsmG